MIKNTKPVIPAGYKKLRAHFLIKHGDMYWSKRDLMWKLTSLMGDKVPGCDVCYYIRKNSLNDIQRAIFTTGAGNHLTFFYNPDIDLLVVDLVKKGDSGGNELVRMTLNETKLLRHCNS